jgi:hypothetical protein
MNSSASRISRSPHTTLLYITVSLSFHYTTFAHSSALFCKILQRMVPSSKTAIENILP